jgi:RNA-directed DNA polymerase
MLHELDMEMENGKGFRFVRYADDFSIYCKTKTGSKENWQQNLCLPTGQTKTADQQGEEWNPPTYGFQILGYGFVPTYQKGVKGKYQLVVEKSAGNHSKPS